jgi:plastocyanin
MHRFLAATVGVACALGLVAVGAVQDTPSAGTPDAPACASPAVGTPSAATASPVAAAPVSVGVGTPVGIPDVCATPGVGGVVVEMIDVAFVPEEVAIPADTPVTFTLPNTGLALHNFSVAALDVSVDVPPGETLSVTITAPAGTYEFICAIPGHADAGMVGTLTVG